MTVAYLKPGTRFRVDGVAAEYTLLKVGRGSAFVRCRREAVTEPPDENGTSERRGVVTQEFTIGRNTEVLVIIQDGDAATGDA